MSKADHQRKTATVDVPTIAKGKRIRRTNEAHAERMRAKDAGEPKAPSRWPKRKLQSRSTFERRA